LKGRSLVKRRAVVIGSGIGGSGIAALLAHLGNYEVDIEDERARTFFGLILALCFVTLDYETPVGEYAHCCKEGMFNSREGTPL
jgi:hypothetical protein